MKKTKTELVNYKDSALKSLPLAKDDLQEIVNLSIQGIRRFRAGRPIYADSDEGLQAFLDDTAKYFEYLQEVNGSDDEGNTDAKKLIPGIEGLCTFIGISRQTLMMYERRSQVWHEAIEYIRTVISGAKLQLAQRFKLPPVVLFFDLGNNAGYVSANSVRDTPMQTIEQKPLSNKALLESLPGAVVEQVEQTPDNGIININEKPKEGAEYEIV